jgi:hypothetical protein
VRAAAVLLVVVIAVASLWSSPLEPLKARSAELSTQFPMGETVLSDDSHIFTANGTELEVVENTGPRFALALRTGQARFEVTPGTGRQWHIDVGTLAVDVVGTVFTIDRADVIRVTVERGAVVVRGSGVPDGVRRLTVGEQFELKLEASAPAVREPVKTPAPEGPRVTSPNHLEPRRASPETEPAPRAAEATEPLSAATLFAQADAARRGGRPAEASASLERLVALYPDSPEAGVAAFTLARLAMTAGRRDEALGWYRRVVQLAAEPLASAAREELRALDGGGW